MKKAIFVLGLTLSLFTSITSGFSKEREYKTGVLLNTESETVFGPIISNKIGDTIVTNNINHQINYLAIAVDGLTHIVAHSAKWRWSDSPNFIIGDPVEVAIEGDKMFLKRNNGKKDFKAKIVKTIRNQAVSSQN